MFVLCDYTVAVFAYLAPTERELFGRNGTSLVFLNLGARQAFLALYVLASVLERRALDVGEVDRLAVLRGRNLTSFYCICIADRNQEFSHLGCFVQSLTSGFTGVEDIG